jgi:hypothetical protein
MSQCSPVCRISLAIHAVRSGAIHATELLLLETALPICDTISPCSLITHNSAAVDSESEVRVCGTCRVCTGSKQWKHVTVPAIRTAAESPLSSIFILLDGEKIVGLSVTSVYLQTVTFQFSLLMSEFVTSQAQFRYCKWRVKLMVTYKSFFQIS